MELFLATKNGVLQAHNTNGSWQTEKRGLDGRTVTSIIAREGVILAGTTDGIFRSDDCGVTWYEQSNGLSERHVRWLGFHPDISDCEFAGTEPADFVQVLLHFVHVTLPESTGVADEFPRLLHALELCRAAVFEIEFLVVEDMHDQHVVPAMAQHVEPFEQAIRPFPLDKQIGDQHDHPFL